MVMIRISRKSDLPDVLEVWRRSVGATHDFFTEQDFQAIEREVAEKYLPRARLWVTVDRRDMVVAFMGLTDCHVDSFFVDPDERAKGLGTALINHARKHHQRLTLEVYEQNHQAVAFYLHLGFSVTGRSPTDGEGRPYPLLHMAG